MKDNSHKGKILLPQRQEGHKYKGRPRKDIPLQEVVISSFIRSILQANISRLSLKSDRNISFVSYGNSLIIQSHQLFQKDQDLLIIKLNKYIQTWIKPWSSIHVSYDNFQLLTTMADYFNQSLPPARQETLKYKVNPSNLISAMILANQNDID